MDVFFHMTSETSSGFPALSRHYYGSPLISDGMCVYQAMQALHASCYLKSTEHHLLAIELIMYHVSH